MRALSLYLLLVCLAGTAVAQRNYTPATIITLQKDSLHGAIDYRNWNITPSEIRFRKDKGAADQTFRPADITGFVIHSTNELYMSKLVKLDITQQSISYLLNTTERTYKQDTVFAMQLVQGALNLYEYTDLNSREHYFYDAEDRKPEELLLIKKGINTPATGAAIQVVEHYRDQLYLLFNDCETARKSSTQVNFNERALTNIFEKYNSCGGKSTAKVVVRSSKKNKMYFGLLAGASSNSYAFKGQHRLAGPGYSNSTSPLLGVWIDLPFSRDQRKFSMHGDLLYKVLKTDWKGAEQYVPHVERTFDFSYLHLDLLFRYTYPKGQWHPFVNVGVAGAFALKAATQQRLRYSDTETRVEEAINGPRRLEQSLLFGAGMEYSRFQLELRYATSSGFSPYNALKVSVSSYQAMLKYRLF